MFARKQRNNANKHWGLAKANGSGEKPECRPENAHRKVPPGVGYFFVVVFFFSLWLRQQHAAAYCTVKCWIFVLHSFGRKCLTGMSDGDSLWIINSWQNIFRSQRLHNALHSITLLSLKTAKQKLYGSLSKTVLNVAWKSRRIPCIENQRNCLCSLSLLSSSRA